MIITLNSLLGRSLVSTSISLVLLGFNLVPLSGTHSSFVSFWLNFYLYFYVCGRSVTLLNLGEGALCMGYPMCPSSTLLSCHSRARGLRVSGQVLTCVFQTHFHMLQDCIFLASGVCPLVGKAGLEACAGFLAGGENGTLSHHVPGTRKWLELQQEQVCFQEYLTVLLNTE